jgi:hypothetical protein
MRRYTKIGDERRGIGSETLSLPRSERVLLGSPYASVSEQKRSKNGFFRIHFHSQTPNLSRFSVQFSRLQTAALRWDPAELAIFQAEPVSAPGHGVTA